MAKSHTSVEGELRVMSDDVRWEKVIRLRTVISEGSYHVSAKDLAEKLLQRMGAGRDVLGYQLCFDDTEGSDAGQE